MNISYTSTCLSLLALVYHFLNLPVYNVLLLYVFFIWVCRHHYCFRALLSLAPVLGLLVLNNSFVAGCNTYSFFKINTLLLNTLNFLHPLFLYTVINYNLVLSLLVFSLLLSDTSVYRFKVNKCVNFLYYFLALAFLTFFLGSW